MYRKLGQRLSSVWEPARGMIVGSASGARAGSLRLRSGDLELDLGLGPEVSDAAPMAYDRSVVLWNPETFAASAVGEFCVSATSDLRRPARDGTVCAAAELRSIRIDVTPTLLVRASSISTSILLAKEGRRLLAATDVRFEDAVLEIDGVGPIALPPAPAADTRIRPELLSPLGMALTLNTRLFCNGSTTQHCGRLAALCLRFERDAVRGLHHAGEVEIGITTAELRLATSAHTSKPAILPPPIPSRFEAPPLRPVILAA